MRIKCFIFIVFLVFANSLLSQDFFNDVIRVERNYQDSTGFYVIEFNYQPNYYSVPDTNPPGQPHFFATIKVYQVIDGKKKQIGDSFEGTYTQSGCFEDDSGLLIRIAKKNVKKFKKQKKGFN